MAVIIRLTSHIVATDSSDGSSWVHRDIRHSFVARDKTSLEVETRLAKMQDVVECINDIVDNDDSEVEYDLSPYLGVDIAGVDADDAVVFRSQITDWWTSSYQS